MAEEEREEKKPIARKGLLIALGIVVLGAAIYFSYQYNSTLFYGVAIGAAVGFLSWFFSKKEEKRSIVVTLLIFALIGGVIGYFFEPISSYAQTGFSSIKSLVLPLFGQFTQKISPYQNLWQSPTTTSQEEMKMSVEFSNTFFRAENPLDVIARIIFSKTKTDMKIIPASCSLDGTSLDIETGIPGNALTFKKSDIEQSGVLHCTGKAKQGTLKLELQRPVNITAILPVTISKTIEKNLGAASSRTDAPYSLVIGSYSNQPLTPGTYDLYVMLKKNENAELVDVKSVKIMTASMDLEFECSGFSGIEEGNLRGIEISNLDSAALKNYAQSPTNDLYVFNCKLKVSGAEEEGKLFIISETLYNVKNLYTTKISAIA